MKVGQFTIVALFLVTFSTCTLAGQGQNKQHIVLVGNPGVGKSFILNSLIGKVKFMSGVSIRTGMTTKLGTYEDSDYVYCDTPGLDDVTTREEAGREISKAFRGGSETKLIFVVTLESGRLKPADLTTINVVLTAIEKAGVDPSGQYSVIVNKVTKPVMEKFHTVQNREVLRVTFSLVKELRHFEFFPLINEANDETNYLITDGYSSYSKFVADAPTFRLPRNANVKLVVGFYEKLIEWYKTALQVLQEKVKKLEKALDDGDWISHLAEELRYFADYAHSQGWTTKVAKYFMRSSPFGVFFKNEL